MNTPEKDAVTANKKRTKRGKLSTGKKVAISIILGLYVIILAAVSLFVFYRPQPIRETMTQVIEVTDENGNVVGTQVIDKNPVANNVDSYNILVLGHDRAAMLTDVFMLVNINNVDKSITIMQIPRDTWVSDHNGHYVATNKINAVFSTYFNYHRYQDGMDVEEAYDEALSSVADVLSKSLFINIDYSVIMDLDGFQQIVDILGGVEMYVERAMVYNDPTQNLYINIPAGQQTLNGYQAEGFVRFRQGYSTADLGRQNAQKQFLAALFNTAKTSVSLSNVADIANAIFTYIDTDMSVDEIAFFAKSLLQCDLSSMNMMTMPGNLASGYYVMNREAVLNVMNTCYNDAYEGDIEDGAFDPNALFNNSSNYSINNAYNLPGDQVFDDSVHNGEDVADEGIDIPWNY